MPYPEYTVCKHQALRDEYKDLVAEFGDSKRLTRLQSRIGCMFGIPAGPAKDKQFADVVTKLEYARRDLRALRAKEVCSTDIHPQVPMEGHGRLSRDPSLERDHLKRGKGTDPGRRHRDTRSPSIGIMQPSEHQRLRLYDRQASAGGELELRDRLEVQRLERVWQMELQRVDKERAQRERLVKDRNDELIAEQRRRAEQLRAEHERVEKERLQRERDVAVLVEQQKLEVREKKRRALLRDIYMLKGHMACERDGDEEAGKIAAMMLDVLAQEKSPFAIEWKALNLGLIEFLKYKKRGSAWAAKVIDKLLELTVAVGVAHKGAEELEVAGKLYNELVVITREEPVDTYGVTGSALMSAW
ncbi:Protein ssh4 [Elsinoe australis]|uniref:Protein ssh4 n=1 Tax=Elsinoe australis TaxID=40998 RepID=A0A2P8A4D6_9PEZI|nr:Protein ssh4 [Elsinoe australis]